MAEQVELHIENMIPELELMEKLGIFSKDEKRGILKRRKQFEYRLQRVSKSKEDLLRYIQYEMGLLKVTKQRISDKGLQQKRSNLEYNIVNRLNKLFSIAVRRFPSDCKIWLSYIKFCRQVRFYTCVSRLLDQMLELHTDKPSLFKLAAQWEYNECHSIERARKFIHQGLHLHKNSKLLYTEGYRLELAYSNQKSDKNKEKVEGEEEESTTDPVAKGRLAEVIFDSAVKKINDVTFMINFLNIAQQFSFTNPLQDKIIQALSSKYPNEEVTWDTLARRELELGGTLKERIGKCISVYEDGLKSVPTRKMWSLYLDYVLEVCEEQTTLPNYRKNCLETAFEAAHKANMLSEKYYVLWLRKVENVDTEKVLQWSTERLGDSSKLWSWRLRHYLAKGDEETALAVFREIVSNPNIPDQANLWILLIKYYQITDASKCENLWKKGVNNPIVGATLKGRYIEWLAVTRGILAARKVYNQLAITSPFSLDLHVIMAKLEDAQPKLSLKSIRNVYEIAINQFGKSNTDVWLWYVKFEEQYGDPLKVPAIYDKATTTLHTHLIDVFVSEYHLNKAETLITNRESEDEDESVSVKNSNQLRTSSVQESTPSKSTKKSRESSVKAGYESSLRRSSNLEKDDEDRKCSTAMDID